MLNLLTSGQLKTFLPVTYLSRSGLTLIRPLLYYREAEIIELVRKLGLKPLKNPCEYDGHTKRQTMKEFIPELEKRFPEVYSHLGAAMRQSPAQELWPAQLTQKEMAQKFQDYWKQKNGKGASR